MLINSRWLLECNASPSLSAETQWDYDLKHNMLNDVFDIIDVDKKNKGPKSKTGGFDLVYNDGPVKHEKSSRYVSFLGKFRSSLLPHVRP